MGTFDDEPEWLTPKRHYPVEPLKLSRKEQAFLDYMRREAASSDEPWLPRRKEALDNWNRLTGENRK